MIKENPVSLLLRCAVTSTLLLLNHQIELIVLENMLKNVLFFQFSLSIQQTSSFSNGGVFKCAIYLSDEADGTWVSTLVYTHSVLAVGNMPSYLLEDPKSRITVLELIQIGFFLSSLFDDDDTYYYFQ